MNEPVTSSTYDAGRGEIRRLTRLAVLARFLPLGNLADGPGLRCLTVLHLLHVAGPLLFRLAIRWEDRLHHLHVLVRRRRGGSPPDRSP